MNAILFPLVVLLLLACGGRAASQGKEIKLPPGLDAKPLEETPGDDKLRQMQKQRFNAALSETRLLTMNCRRSSGTGPDLVAGRPAAAVPVGNRPAAQPG